MLNRPLLHRYLSTTCLSAAAAVVLVASGAQANPDGGVVSAGSATITATGNKLDIVQTTDRAVIDWRSFDIGVGEHTQFYQPSSTSIAVNRIGSGNASVIAGQLSANGKVVIVNPNGVMFSGTSQVDVGGLVATSSSISNDNVMAGGTLALTPSTNPNASIVNNGTITVADAGLVGFVAPNVVNNGIITAKLGKVHLASGDSATVDFYGDGLVNLAVSDDVTSQLVSSTGVISASGGTIALTAAAGREVVNSVINVEGILEARSVAEHEGAIIILSTETVMHTGEMNVSGPQAGSVSITAKKIANQGVITANSSAGKGGSISIHSTEAYLDSEASRTSATGTGGNGGTINVIGAQGSRAFISGAYDVSSSRHTGGKAQITAEAGDLKLFGARVNADGKTGGGTINIGGEFQGRGTLAHANTTSINYATYLSANAIDSGNGGEVVVWSDETTKFGGHAFARGGSISGNGGLIELSSKNELHIAGNAETSASAANGQAGQLLLDPKNIIIANGGLAGGLSSFEFVDPNADTGVFGNQVTVLSNGNVVVADSQDDFAASNAGAVYLFNGITGALISTLTGSTASDAIGNGGITALTNGNYVVGSSAWDGADVNVGAATWGSGTTGLSGIISAANSLVGSLSSDGVGGTGTITALTNGNYVVRTTGWDDGGTANAGAVTWGNGTGGTVGAISAANSLVGSTIGDQIGTSVTALANGNYVVSSTTWDNGAFVNAGAVTWGNGLGGTVGAVSAANSLVGSAANDRVGNGGIATLTNGNYVAISYFWSNGAAVQVGAVTWGDGATGTVGAVSAANSLVGSTTSDNVGYDDVTVLSNGNYVVGSSLWKSGGTSVGAATWGNGMGGTVGAVSAANSLVGSTSGDGVGSYGTITALTNGNYVLSTTSWDNGAVANAGAVTWGNGLGGTLGAVSAANSLVGTTANDNVGLNGVTALNNGNYVVRSSNWDNGAVVNAGAVTWGNGLGGTLGAVSAANSLVGSTANDVVGGGFIIALSNGNYVVSSSFWDNGAVVDAGAATWGNGTGGTVGAVSAANSLVGSNVEDQVGNGILTALSNGNYVVRSRLWNGVGAEYGAVTWGNGTTGIFGTINATNSLVGSTDFERVGNSGVTALTNGNYVVVTDGWDNGAVVNAGAVTWGNGTSGTVGTISTANSLFGSTSGDITSVTVVALTNGNYVIRSANWDNGAIVNAGSVTWGNGTGGTVGAVSASNSLVGSTASDQIGTSITALANGNYAVRSTNWDNGAVVNAGAVTLGNGLGGTVGSISSANSLIGPSANSGLNSVAIDTVNGRIVSVFSTAQRVYSLSDSYAVLGSYDSYADQSTSSVTLAPGFLTAVLNAGTAVVLQASNDITVTDDIIANNASGNGGALTLQAGRSILINADITTDNGDLNLFANERLATGVVNAQRDAGAAAITMGVGATIDAGTGNVTIRLDDGLGKTNLTAGNISLRDITANTILARNNNATGDIILNSGALIANAAAGNSIILSSLRNVINNAGAGALSVGGTARWLTYSTSPADDTLGGLTASFRRFSCTYGGTCPALGTGNGFAYSITPILTATATALAPLTYGDAAPSLVGYAYGITGYLGSDSGADTLGGSLTGTTTYSAGSNIGTYNINYSSGALTSAMGYGFTYANNASAITIGQRALTVTTNPATKTFGTPDPTFTGSNNLIASDIPLISWAYAPIGYSGAQGSYTIAATATDASSRLANYIRTDNYGQFTVTAGGSTPPANQIPQQVVSSFAYTPVFTTTQAITISSTNIFGIGNGTFDSVGTFDNSSSITTEQPTTILTTTNPNTPGSKPIPNPFITITPELQAWLDGKRGV